MNTAKKAVAVVVPAPARTEIGLLDKKTEPYARSFCCSQAHLPRRYEITAPRNPNKPRLTMISPVGIPRDCESVSSGKTGSSRAGGGVKVGKRVGVC